MSAWEGEVEKAREEEEASEEGSERRGDGDEADARRDDRA
jgi:hypothetical protein